MASEDGTRFHIYVIELAAAAAEDAGMQSRNPDRDPAKPCLYVGYTNKTVAERFEDHRQKKRTASRITKKYDVVRLRPDLYENKYALSRDKAEQLEERLATKLRAQGYAVWQA